MQASTWNLRWKKHGLGFGYMVSSTVYSCEQYRNSITLHAAINSFKTNIFKSLDVIKLLDVLNSEK